MKTVLKTVVTALAASVAAAASAGKAKTAFEAAAENKALVDRYRTRANQEYAAPAPMREDYAR